MLWRYRDISIFSAAGLFAAKALIHPDFASVIGMSLCLTAHYVDRFFSSELAEARLEVRVKALEDGLKIVGQDVGHVKMAQGLRTGLVGGR